MTSQEASLTYKVERNKLNNKSGRPRVLDNHSYQVLRENFSSANFRKNWKLDHSDFSETLLKRELSKVIKKEAIESYKRKHPLLEITKQISKKIVATKTIERYVKIFYNQIINNNFDVNI
jgi:hypothetical protein